jgi:hypothetical protein
MYKKILLFVALLFSFAANSQAVADSQTKRDIGTLKYIVEGFLGESTRNYHEGRKSEVIMMLLEMDSNGIVFAIHLLADNDNLDSTYSRAKQMKPSDFGGTKFTLWKDKIVTMPIYSLMGDYKLVYVEKSIMYYSGIIAKRGSVMIPPFYFMPYGPSER